MSIQFQLKNLFERSIRERGERYFQRQSYSVNRLTEDQLTLFVKGEYAYLTVIKKEKNDLHFDCDCPYFEKDFCKHLWVSVLYLDKFAPNFLENLKPNKSTPLRTDVKDQNVLNHLANIKSLIIDERDVEDYRSEDEQKRRQIFYVLQEPYSQRLSDELDLKLMFYQKEMRKNGQWGALKPIKLSIERWSAQVEGEDKVFLKKLLSLLPVKHHNEDYWHRQQYYIGAKIPPFEYGGLLKELVDSNKVFFYSDRDYKKVQLHQDVKLEFDIFETEKTVGVKPVFFKSDECKRTEIEFKKALAFFGRGLFLTDQTELLQTSEAESLLEVASALQTNAFEVSKEKEKDFEKHLSQIIPFRSVNALESWSKPSKAVCVPRVSIEDYESKDPNDSRLALFTEVSFSYPMESLEEDLSTSFWVQDDLEQEKKYLSQLESMSSWQWLDKSEKVGFFNIQTVFKDLPELVKTGWSVLFNKNEVSPSRNSKFEIVSSGLDWFDLKAEVQFEGELYEVDKILEALKENKNYISLKSGKIGILPEDLTQKLQQIRSFLNKRKGKYGLSEQQLPFLSEFVEESIDKGFKNKLDSYQKIKKLKAAKEPRAFKGKLHDYQKLGLNWLKNLDSSSFSGCLADDMGLGKTVQVLSFLQYLKSRGKQKKPHLIVVPKSLLHNWQDEVSKFCPALKILEYSGPDRVDTLKSFALYDIVVMTYGVLLRDEKHLLEKSFSYIILDEAQAIKNRLAKTYHVIRSLTSEKRLAITGTPVENHVKDLVNIFDFLNPGMIGSKFREAINGKGINEISEESIELLHRGLSPLILRRKKEEVLTDLPDKVESYIFCEFENKQKKLYESLKNHYKEGLKKSVDEVGFQKSKMYALEALLRLRQVACHPALIEGQSGESQKVTVVLERIKELVAQGKKVLVFSQFVKLLKIVEQYIDEETSLFYLDGKTTKRKDVVSSFQNHKGGAAFLISLKAGGVGLNLTSASYCFLLDPWWNPAVEAQALDRAHRIGQKNKVFAYRLVTKGSVEEKIIELQKHKKNVSKAIIDGKVTSAGVSSFSFSDIQDLLE